VTAPRRIEKFTDRLESETVSFDGPAFAWRSEQQFRSGRAAAAGQHYPVRLMGYGPGLKDLGRELVSYNPFGDPDDVDDLVDELRSKCHRFGVGKLWTVDDASDRRWCWASLEGWQSAMDAFTQFDRPHELRFERWSNWFAEDPTTGSHTLNGALENFAIVNAGVTRVTDITFRFRSNGSPGVPAPFTLTNATNGQALTIARDMVGAALEERLRTGAMACEHSTDDGTSYADDYDQLTLPATQAVLMELEPGSNSFFAAFDATPDGVLEWSFYAAFDS
jgi:hypothetical protein